MQQGRCTNFGNCTKADNREVMTVPEGQEAKCPICDQRLTLMSKGGGRPSPLPLIFSCLGCLGVLALGYFAFNFFTKKKDTPTTTNQTANQPSGGGAGDFSSGSGSSSNNNTTTPTDSGTKTNASTAPAVGVGDVLMFYERSNEAWIRKAAEDFNSQNPGSSIVLDYRGSREGFREILDGKAQPVIWNPADTFWPDKLKEDWKKNPKNTGEIVSANTPILKTKLVLVMGKDRAEKFGAAMRESKFRGKTWGLLHTLATKGWSEIGGEAAWGKLKLSHSSPVKSNGGMMTIAMMLAEYKLSNPAANQGTPGFLTFMKEIEAATGGEFTDTTSKGLDVFLKDRNRYDVAICYETNAIKAIVEGANDIKVVYPDATVDVKFPAATISGSWVSSERAALAKKFVDYLLTADIQKDAIQYGFRPAREMRSELDAYFGDSKFSGAGLTTSPNTTNLSFDVKTLNDLVYRWNKDVPHN